MTAQKTVLVLCTGNSCRSQMAAAYLSAYGGERLEVESAGTEPAKSVHPLTAAVMAEDGFDLSGRRPSDYRPFVGRSVDYLISVCDAAATTCSTGWPGVGERLVWSFADPAAFRGSPDETLAEFRRVRDEIKARIQDWLETT